MAVLLPHEVAHQVLGGDEQLAVEVRVRVRIRIRVGVRVRFRVKGNG